MAQQCAGETALGLTRLGLGTGPATSHATNRQQRSTVDTPGSRAVIEESFELVPQLDTILRDSVV